MAEEEPIYANPDNLDRLYDNIKRREVQTFDTVAAMQAATYLEAGMTCHTNGFHSAGDGGAAYYTVGTTGTANGMDVLALQGGLVATLVVTEPYVTPEMFGAYGDETHDDTNAFAAAIGTSKTLALNEDSGYLVGTVQCSDIIILGNNATIINATDSVLFNASGTVDVCDLSIVNEEVFHYESSVDMYGTINCKDFIGQNISVTNVNKSFVYCTGNCIVDNISIDNAEFDIKTTFDGSANNQIFGFYIKQTADTKSVEIVNSSLKYLISGIYVGTYVDSPFSVNIQNNYFEYCADHCVYLNSYENRCTSIIANNYGVHCGVSFAVVGNNHLIENNVLMYAFDGSSARFGFSLRDSSNVTFRGNKYVSGEYTSPSGVGASCTITSLLSADTQESIKVYDNVFDWNDGNASCIMLRIGYAQQAPIKDIEIYKNVITQRGTSIGIMVNTDANLHLHDNKITYASTFLSSTNPVLVERNELYTEGSAPFQLLINGTYRDNVCDCRTIPFRHGDASVVYLERNKTVRSGVTTVNFINSDASVINVRNDYKGEFTATGTSYRLNAPNPDVLFASYTKPVLLVFDENGNPVSFTAVYSASGYATLTLPSAGTYRYYLL